MSLKQTDLTIEIKQITDANFTESSLDGFDRSQVVKEVWRRLNGEYMLIEQPFTDDWTAERKREIAREILDDSFITYGAFDASRVIGFVMMRDVLVGSRMIIDSFHVSRYYRHRGIGKKLFEIAKEIGRNAGAEKLYISACSSKETIAFYMSMGCRLTDDVIREMAEEEPFDLQIEFKLR